MGELLMDMWAFMKERKKFWLLPIIMWLVLLGGLIVLTSGSVIAHSFTQYFRVERWNSAIDVSRSRRTLTSDGCFL